MCNESFFIKKPTKSFPYYRGRIWWNMGFNSNIRTFNTKGKRIDIHICSVKQKNKNRWTYDDLRKMREAPWRKQEVIDQLQAILENQGKGDKLDKLLKIMLKDYNTKLKGIKAAKQTKGHFISLDKGGLDVAENFGPQKGKSTKNPKTGEWEMGNYAEKADSSIPEGTNVPTTWEEYVALKLPLLK